MAPKPLGKTEEYKPNSRDARVSTGTTTRKRDQSEASERPGSNLLDEASSATEASAVQPVSPVSGKAVPTEVPLPSSPTTSSRTSSRVTLSPSPIPSDPTEKEQQQLEPSGDGDSPVTKWEIAALCIGVTLETSTLIIIFKISYDFIFNAFFGSGLGVTSYLKCRSWFGPGESTSNKTTIMSNSTITTSNLTSITTKLTTDCCFTSSTAAPSSGYPVDPCMATAIAILLALLFFLFGWIRKQRINKIKLRIIESLGFGSQTREYTLWDRNTPSNSSNNDPTEQTASDDSRTGHRDDSSGTNKSTKTLNESKDTLISIDNQDKAEQTSQECRGKDHTSSTLCQFTDCSKTFSQAKYQLNHQWKYQEQASILSNPLNECSYIVEGASQSVIQKHLNTQHAAKYVCQFATCGKALNGKYYLDIHEANHYQRSMDNGVVSIYTMAYPQIVLPSNYSANLLVPQQCPIGMPPQIFQLPQGTMPAHNNNSLPVMSSMNVRPPPPPMIRTVFRPIEHMQNLLFEHMQNLPIEHAQSLQFEQQLKQAKMVVSPKPKPPERFVYTISEKLLSDISDGEVDQNGNCICGHATTGKFNKYHTDSLDNLDEIKWENNEETITLTEVTEIQGDIWAFEKEARLYIESRGKVKEGERILSSVNEVRGKVEFEGDFIEDLALFIKEKGF